MRLLLTFFLTTHGNRYEGVPGQNDYRMIQFKQYAIRSPTESPMMRPGEETLTMTALWQQYTSPKHAAELQWRLSISLSAILLALLALPLSTLQSTYGRYFMLLPAIVIYMIYINLLFVARHWVEEGVVPIAFGMWWVHGMMLLLVASFFASSRINT